MTGSTTPAMLGPTTIFLEILHGCNLRCRYCYIGDDLNHVRPLVPPFSTTAAILAKLKELNVREIQLVGGEPLLHPRLLDICTEIVDLEFQHRGVVTNATKLTPTMAEYFAEYGFWIDISFRGADPETFDDITRSSGSFAAALNGAVLASAAGVRVGIEVDCSPMNYRQLTPMVETLTSSGVALRQVQLHRVAPFGNASATADFHLTAQQWEDVLQQARRIQDVFYIPVVLEDALPLCLFDRQFWDIIMPCACGYTAAAVDPLGNIRRCACAPGSSRNVLDHDMGQLWAGMVTAAVSEREPICAGCDVRDICRGGCRASGCDGREFFANMFSPVQLPPDEVPKRGIIIGQTVMRADEGEG